MNANRKEPSHLHMYQTLDAQPTYNKSPTHLNTSFHIPLLFCRQVLCECLFDVYDIFYENVTSFYASKYVGWQTRKRT